MATRIHLVIDEADKARYRLQAEREGKSLGAWLRDAAEERLRQASAGADLRNAAELTRFFEACDARESAAEPDWDEQKRLIAASRVEGLGAG